METENKDREMIKALNQKYKELSKLRIEESEIAQKILDKRSEINALETTTKNAIQQYEQRSMEISTELKMNTMSWFILPRKMLRNRV